ncbi:hypothetical protein ABIB48_001773, partial [Arthrobacter sp. UYCu511]
ALRLSNYKTSSARRVPHNNDPRPTKGKSNKLSTGLRT